MDDRIPGARERQIFMRAGGLTHLVTEGIVHMKLSFALFGILLTLFVLVAGCASPATVTVTPTVAPTTAPITDYSGSVVFHLYGPETPTHMIQIYNETKLTAQPDQSVTLNFTVVNNLHRDATFDIMGSAFINGSSASKSPFSTMSISVKDNATYNGTIALKSGISVNDTEVDIGVMETTPGVNPYMTNMYYFNFYTNPTR
jgi:hypothetical protein